MPRGPASGSSFQDKVVLITGATSGIGLSLSKKFVASGATTLLLARSIKSLKPGLTGGGPGKEVLVQCDVRDRAQVSRVVSRLEEEQGPIDILINSAGIGLFSPVAESRESDIRDLVETNVLGCIWLIHAVLPGMRGRKQGTIVNVSSAISKHALPYQGIYSGSKAALERISEALLQEEAPHGIRVVQVIPDRTRTAFRDKSLGEPAYKALPFKLKETDPDHVAEVILKGLLARKTIIYTSLRSRAYQCVSRSAPWLIDRVAARKRRGSE